MVSRVEEELVDSEQRGLENENRFRWGVGVIVGGVGFSIRGLII